jgi:hypothetical protein
MSVSDVCYTCKEIQSIPINHKVREREREEKEERERENPI